MNQDLPVDFTNLREMTSGDKEIERQLFEAFISSSKECLQGMEKALSTKSNEEWRKNAHALKGISLNLGANTLGELCKNAQESSEAKDEMKIQLLKEISIEFAKVEEFLAAQ